MSSTEEKFAEDVLACIEDLNKVLPGLALKYCELVVVAALAEHVGGALRIFLQKGICGQEQAQRVLQHMKHTALAPDPELDKAAASVTDPQHVN
jgi:hypothetical protein